METVFIFINIIQYYRKNNVSLLGPKANPNCQM